MTLTAWNWLAMNCLDCWPRTSSATCHSWYSPINRTYQECTVCRK